MKYKREDLFTVAYDMGIDLLESDRKVDIKNKMQASAEFEEGLVKEQLDLLVEERKAEMEREKEREKLESDRAFELERLRLTLASETNSVASTNSEGTRTGKSIKTVMQKYDPEKSDMVLFLTLFERQARKLNIADHDFVTQLISVLPLEMAELIMREPQEISDDYSKVKEILLNRFKLSPETFRTKFNQHQRKPGALWKDLIFELRSYLDGWLEGVEVKDFEALKNLLIADQIKRCVPGEIKDHFIDVWGLW